MDISTVMSSSDQNRWHPSYGGTDDWHIKGMKNESIVACITYFPLLENVTGGSITFRTAVTFPKPILPDDSEGVRKTWDLGYGDPCNQILGTVSAREGRAIAWPNIYSHRFHMPFRLADPSKEGRLRIITFWLVDPGVSVVSTARVPPVTKKWVRRALEEALVESVPVEIIERIVDFVPGLLDETEVEKVRRKVKEQRRRFMDSNERLYFEVPYYIKKAWR